MKQSKRRRFVGSAGAAAAAIALSSGAWELSCTRVVDAVQPEGCAAQSSAQGCSPTTWPTEGHGANSDPWIVTHHDAITQMSPRVLVLNFYNAVTADAVRQTAERQAAVIAEGSRYHGYADPPGAADAGAGSDGGAPGSAPVFLSYQIAKVVDLADRPPTGSNNPSSSLLPVTTAPNGSVTFDSTALFTARFTALYGIPDKVTPSRNLSLCELFEQGVINEVWIEDGESGPRHAPFNVERKQVYDMQNLAVPGSFLPCVGGGGCLNDVACNVTVRMAHLDPGRGPGCDLEVRGWGVEGMWDALPSFAVEANAFLNRDFRTRFGAPFDGWEKICDEGGTPCVTYPSPTSARGMFNGVTWTINPFVQGCGNTKFAPNSRWRYDYDNSMPVQSRCEHFGLHDGPTGDDTLELYTSDKIAAADQAVHDCGGGWQIYWRQSLPGLGNHATTATGLPLRNWWPLLFY